ncbi:class I SAM-dependent methyltransferase [Pollutibacter soli]|uniref:class I SAM-dependent methyltransferase n=1 Tax=Pollutibacter soli TaxID=3034157 RepID=UPI003014136A
MNDPSTESAPSEQPVNRIVHYDQFFGPLYFEPYAIEVANRIDVAGDSVVLEIAAGTGIVTLCILKNIPASAKFIASDIDEEMLAEAKKKLKHFKVEWQIIDAQQLPFSDESIDLIICCFGYMFVQDKCKAFTEAYRVLKPGGKLLFTTWDKLEKNTASHTARKLAENYLHEPISTTYDLPVSMHDEVEIKELLKKTGFSGISIEIAEMYSVCETAKKAACGLVDGGLIFREIRQQHPESIDEIKAKLENELSQKFGAAPMKASMSALISEARK